MATPVADRSSNKNEQIVHAAEVIGRSEHRYAVFKAIYTGKTKMKSILVLMKALPKMPRTRILDAGKALADNDLVTQTRDGGLTAYTKIEFMQRVPRQNSGGCQEQEEARRHSYQALLCQRERRRQLRNS